MEIVVGMPQHTPKAKPQAKHKYRRSSQQQPTSIPPHAISASISVHTSSLASSPPPSSPDVNPLDGIPLTVLPAPTRNGIVVPPRAMSHLKTLFTPSDDSRTQEMQLQAIQQGFCCEEPATGAHGLLANTLAAAEPPTLVDSGVNATTSDNHGPSLQQHSDIDIDLDVSMGLTDWVADAEGVTDDEVVVPSPTPSAPHPLLHFSSTHEHPDGPMLGFAVPEPEIVDTNGSSLDHARASLNRGLDFDLTSLTSLGPSVSRWAEWPLQLGLVVRVSAQIPVSASILVMGRLTCLFLAVGEAVSALAR